MLRAEGNPFGRRVTEDLLRGKAGRIKRCRSKNLKSVNKTRRTKTGRNTRNN